MAEDLYLPAGKLKDRIVIQQRSTSKDGFGEQLHTWTTFNTVWARVEPLSGKEFFAAQEFRAEVTTKITIRYLSGVLPKMRVSFDGSIYDIHAVMNIIEENKKMVLMCSEIVN